MVEAYSGAITVATVSTSELNNVSYKSPAKDSNQMTERPVPGQ